MEAAHELLNRLIEASVLLINYMALAIILYGTIEAFAKAIQRSFLQTPAEPVFRPIWLRYARWLVAGLTFQLAADIVETSLAPSWEDIGKLAAIAVIRTFLNYFLGRDLKEVEEAPREAQPELPLRAR